MMTYPDGHSHGHQNVANNNLIIIWKLIFVSKEKVSINHFSRHITRNTYRQINIGHWIRTYTRIQQQQKSMFVLGFIGGSNDLLTYFQMSHFAKFHHLVHNRSLLVRNVCYSRLLGIFFFFSENGRYKTNKCHKFYFIIYRTFWLNRNITKQESHTVMFAHTMNYFVKS